MADHSHPTHSELAEIERLRGALEEARSYLDSLGDFMLRPMDLIERIDRVLDDGWETRDG